MDEKTKIVQQVLISLNIETLKECPLGHNHTYTINYGRQDPSKAGRQTSFVGALPYSALILIPIVIFAFLVPWQEMRVSAY